MMTIETRTHTALHVLKGAVVKVLGARWTAGVHVKGNHGRLTLQFDRKPTPEEVIRIVSAAGDVLQEERLAPRLNKREVRMLASDFAGPVLPIAAFVLAGLEARGSTDRWHSVLFERWYLFLCFALVSAVCAFVITRRFSFSSGRVWFWTTMGFVFGPVGLFTLLCLESWPARECCDACGRPRLVTRSQCEHCGAEWPAPQPDGTEIFEAA